jgi:lipoate-protein ligase B
MAGVRRRLEVWRMAGLVNYGEALVLQQSLVERRRRGGGDVVLSLQHPPTFTVGKRRTVHNLLASPQDLKAIGAELHFTERGGDITYHGPGQPVLYPVLGLRDLRVGVRAYVEGLEDVMVEVCKMHGVHARGRMEKETGVWVQGLRKIGAIGVRVSSGSITSHGLAFNVDPDLAHFSHIVPCGIPDKEVTSMRKEISPAVPDVEEVTEQLIQSLAKQFGFAAVVDMEPSSFS